jgi:hypothetical protein
LIGNGYLGVENYAQAAGFSIHVLPKYIQHIGITTKTYICERQLGPYVIDKYIQVMKICAQKLDLKTYQDYVVA